MNPLETNWRALFDAALAAGSKQAVADEIGVSRTAVSLVAAGKYHGRLDKFAQRVIDTYDRYDCPHLGCGVTANACRAHALRPAPTSSAREARHWRACQACPLKPSKEAT